MHIIASTVANRGVFRLTGRFDFNDHRVFKAAYEPVLQQDGVSVLEFDLSGVDYVDSSALGMLMLMRERAEAAGKRVELKKPNPTVRQILDIANFAKLFTIS